MRLQTEQPLPGTQIDPLYPDSDGRPMGDTDYHANAMIWLREALEDFFAVVADVYVACNLLLYYDQGNPRGRRDPDVLVARGVGKHRRRSFRVWEEKTLPCTLFEIASRKTWKIDLHEKPILYARLGIPEYFIFDPEAKYLKPPLQGFRLKQGKYVALKPGKDGSLVSKELGLRLVPEGEMLRLVDLVTGQKILTRMEATEQEKQRARKAAQRTRREKQRAEEEKQRAEEEKQRADQLVAELERLKARLAEHEPPSTGNSP